MTSLLITGACERPGGFELGDGKYYGKAKLLRLQIESGHIEPLLTVDRGTENFPDEHPNLEFTAGAVEPGRLWLPMDTEVRLYGYPGLEHLKTFSHPCFNNVHSVAVAGSELFVTSTGLDLVVVLDKQTGGVKRHIDVQGRSPWHKFSPDIDYRKVHSTRPHDGHPNFVFWLDGKPWVTRCTQEDAASLDNPARSFDVSGKHRPISIHDGIVCGSQVYFTLVSGHIVILERERRNQLRVINLASLRGAARGARGWCRGLCRVGEYFFVAFSRLRKTRAKHNLRWLQAFSGRDIHTRASILCVDLKAQRVVRDFAIELGMIDAIYSLLPEPDSEVA